MKYTEENYTPEPDNDLLMFSGKIETSDYTDLSGFLTEADQTVAADIVVYDPHSLVYMNSSGIKAIAIHLLNSLKFFRIIIKSELTWQKAGVAPLRFIKPGGHVIVES